MPDPRSEHLAATFDRLADALREGDAEVCGYHVRRREGRHVETGGVTVDGTWTTFEIEAPERE